MFNYPRPTTTTDYLSGFQDNVLEFFPHAEGYVKYTEGYFNYVFNYTDHLGNVRLSYAKDPNGGTTRIMEENHYYPFGLKQTNYDNGTQRFMRAIGPGDLPVIIAPDIFGSGSYKYKYNGKELQDELGLNWYDYHARNYDPAVGRWPCIDPQAELLERSSPYVYALNSPLIYVDNDGELPILMNGKTTSDSERADVSYWTASIVNTIKGSGIANPGGEVHYVDGNKGHSWYGRSGGYASKDDNVLAPIRKAQGGRYAANGDWKTILSKLARDPEMGKIIEKIQIYTQSRGAAFGVGYTERLLKLIKENSSQFADASNVIDFVYNMAPHQSDFLTAPNGVDSYSMDHDRDKLSDNDMKGVKGAFSSGEKSKGFFGAHSITSFQNDLKAFASSFLKGGTSQDIINNFVKTMKDKYGVTVTVQ